jgi:hypothetical protein
MQGGNRGEGKGASEKKGGMKGVGFRFWSVYTIPCLRYLLRLWDTHAGIFTFVYNGFPPGRCLDVRWYSYLHRRGMDIIGARSIYRHR